ncbi:hypothetical protein FRD01_10285 [Microvenator marinus]|jgi:hypothetical protein|uniref:Uncharacterized protein n=1 Tax=Microvenator marinus TaxID=2600177 RepID=A0A5B8XPU5_9DELT|nr:hypothetical protein [Microvenator marinus]QED27620.1 hypothetical protein FRD01_10285 [Microvenator marinus]
MRVLLVAVVFLSGCELFYNTDNVRFIPGTDTPDMSAQDMAQDAGTDMAEQDMPDQEADAPQDMQDMPSEDQGPDLDPVVTCEVGGQILGECDPIEQNCEGGESCIQFFSPVEMTLINNCGDGSTYLVPEGQACEANSRCQPGLLCRDTCRRMCDRFTGRGCEPGESCVTFENTYGFGFCADSCDFE